MNKDIFPAKDSELWGFLNSFKKTVAQSGGTYGLTPTEISEAVQLCNEFADQIMIAKKALDESKSQVTKKKAMRKTHLGKLRRAIKRMKGMPNFTNSAAAGFGLQSHQFNPDAQEYVPDFKVDVSGELIRVRFKKRGIDCMEFYGSCNDGEFQHLGTRMHSPFWFKPTPLENNGPQKWKIKVVGVKKDKHFGKWSGTATVLYQNAEGL